MQIGDTTSRAQRTRNALVRVAAISQSDAADGETRRRMPPESGNAPAGAAPKKTVRRVRAFVPYLTQLSAQQTAGRYSAAREQRRNPGAAISAYGAADALRTSIRRTQPRSGVNLDLSDI